MSLEDEVEARRAAARRVRDEAARSSSAADADREAGRVELRRLIAEAYDLLHRRGGPRAVVVHVAQTRTLFRGVQQSATGREVGYAVDSGHFIFLDDGTLRHQGGLGPARLDDYAPARSAVIDAYVAARPGVVSVAIGGEILWALTRPLGWDDQFFVDDDGRLVFGSSESVNPPLAKTVIATWVAGALHL